MRKLGLITVIMLMILLIAGCTKTATITGTVTYREKIALPPQGVVITVKVEDVSRADAPAITIGEQIIENPAHQVPIPFEIEYNPDDIDERYTYAMRVRIEVDGELWFINTTRYQVVTRGFPTSDVEVMLEKVGPRETATLEDTTWVLESFGERGNLKTLIKDTEITIEFKSAEGQFSGTAGCNHYFGSYEVTGSNLSVPGPIGATEMSCGEDIDKQEREYLSTLQTARSYNIEDGGLTIICGAPLEPST
jgi:putative lipoprotein